MDLTSPDLFLSITMGVGAYCAPSFFFSQGSLGVLSFSPQDARAGDQPPFFFSPSGATLAAFLFGGRAWKYSSSCVRPFFFPPLRLQLARLRWFVSPLFLAKDFQ